MPLEPDSQDVPDSLLQALMEVIRGLKGEPVLLTGMGASSLLAVIAIFVPTEARIIVWLIAGLTLVLCLVWAVVVGGRSVRRRRHTQIPEGNEGYSNELEAGAKVKIGRIRLVAERRNRARVGRKSEINDISMIAGPSADIKDKSPKVAE